MSGYAGVLHKGAFVMGIVRSHGLAGLVLLFLLAVAVPARAFTVQQVVSPGGISAWLVEDHTLPVVSVAFGFAGGAATDPVGKEGRAYMTAAMLGEGAGKLDSQAFRRVLETQAINLGYGSSMDATTGFLLTTTGTLDEAFDLLRLTLTAPRFDKAPLERLRHEYTASLSLKQEDPGDAAGRTMTALLFGDHPYARPLEGTPQSIRSMRVKDLRAHMKSSMTRDRLKIGVAGDLTPSQLGTLLDQTFGSLPATGTAPAISPVVPALDGRVTVVDMDVPQSVVLFNDQGIDPRDPDIYAAMLMDYVLGAGSFASRLMNEVREKRGLVYGISTSLRGLDKASFLSGHFATSGDKVAEAMDLVRAEWRKMAEDGVTEDELDAAKANLAGSWPLGMTSTGNIANRLYDWQAYDRSPDYFNVRNARLQAVTREDIKRVARRILDEKRLTFVIAGRPQGVESTPAP
ncbi:MULTISPECIES: M16 family metallopeptidase [unclassified Haematospirillum]|uniref:M16 family metallopeptidase n=1 Tax=unclassified Haematospirillum TaxID=2622088 RepID=UPI001439B096|nr:MULTISPECIES: pitrilysin family protein [unclassified Haematospirillum]NKD55240.1 insulinase family protein [Haematospirillum sp. H4890]NKD75125.1 insulinase family protein [Haematospirillum sp. H4485]NKD87331.1 insulinase family protein [Haematospirillum sp. 15-248]